jgi:hypothetical protein
MADRVAPGKYAIVRTAPSQDPAVYVLRARNCGLTGLVFRVSDPAQLGTEWLPNAGGEDWQQVQQLLVTGLDAMVAAGLKVGLLFEGTRGAYEAPASEGSSYAGVMRVLDPVGIKIDFCMVDITGDARWAALDDPLDDIAPYGTAAKKLCHLVAGERWTAVGRPRPIFLITPATPMDDWPGTMWDGRLGGDPVQRVFAPGYEWSCLPVVAAAHKLDPANGTGDISTAWSWHATVGGWQMMRGESVFDLRGGAIDGEMLKGLISYVVAGFDIELPVGGGTCIWHPTCGLVVLDDLDSIEAQGLHGYVASADAPGGFWDLQPVDPEACYMEDWCNPGIILWPLEQPVLPPIFGAPWQLTLAIENWRDGSVNHFSLYIAPADPDPAGLCTYYGPCNAFWLFGGGDPCAEHDSITLIYNMDDVIDPLTGLEYEVITFSTSAVGAPDGHSSLPYGPAETVYHCLIRTVCAD